MKRPFGRILKGLTNHLLTIIILQTGGQCCSIYNDRLYLPFDPKTTEETSSRSLRQKKHGLRWKRKRPGRAESGKGTGNKRQGNDRVCWSPNGVLERGVGIRRWRYFPYAKHCLRWVIRIFLPLKWPYWKEDTFSQPSVFGMLDFGGVVVVTLESSAWGDIQIEKYVWPIFLIAKAIIAG